MRGRHAEGGGERGDGQNDRALGEVWWWDGTDNYGQLRTGGRKAQPGRGETAGAHTGDRRKTNVKNGVNGDRVVGDRAQMRGVNYRKRRLEVKKSLHPPVSGNAGAHANRRPRTRRIGRIGQIRLIGYAWFGPQRQPQMPSNTADLMRSQPLQAVSVRVAHPGTIRHLPTKRHG